MNSPWGITLAPTTFGQFHDDLLVGNFGDGRINAFNPTTGAFLGTLSDAGGNPIVNSGLWSLRFRDPASSFDPNALFFTAGINAEADGLLGQINVAGRAGALDACTPADGPLGRARPSRRPAPTPRVRPSSRYDWPERA